MKRQEIERLDRKETKAAETPKLRSAPGNLRLKTTTATYLRLAQTSTTRLIHESHDGYNILHDVNALWYAPRGRLEHPARW